MKEEENKYETISFLDVDTDSGKMTSLDFKQNSSKIPEVVPEIQTEEDDTPLTLEQEEILNGTYIENEKKREIERENAKKQAEVRKFNTICIVLVTVVLCFFTFGAYLKVNETLELNRIQEKVDFLTNNAVYGNNIRAIYTNLRSNAAEFQSGVRTKTKYEYKAKEYLEEIEGQISSLHSSKDLFIKYEAEALYDNLDERLGQAKALAEYQKEHFEALDVVLKTNAYITAEESSQSRYITRLEDYLKTFRIPYSYENGNIKYKID